jgi:TP901 family phage tail tape measure protein
MADVQKTIEIVFGTVDKTSGALKDIADGISDFTGGVQDATQPLADLTDSIIKTDVAVAALAIGMAAWTTNAAGQFYDATNEIFTLVETSPENFGQFQEDIKEFASGSTQAIEDINGAIYQAISAGVEYTDSLAFLEAAEKSAVAGKSTLKEAVTLLMGTMNAYGAEVDSVGKYQDVMQLIVKEGITTFPALADSIGAVTPSAATLGVDIETLGAAVATLTSKAIKTPETITAINAVLTGLLKPSKEATDIAEALGIEFSAQAVKAKGLDVVLQDVAKATGGNQETMAKLFGSTEALKAVFGLTANESEVFKEKLLKMRDAAGTVDEAYAKMADNFSLQNQKIVNNLELVLIAAGEPLLKSYGDLATSLTDILKSLGKEFDAPGGGVFKPIIDAVVSLGELLTDAFDDIAFNLPAALAQLNFDELLRAFGDLGDALSDIFGDVDFTSVEGLQKAMQSVIDGITMLVDATKGIVVAFGPVIDKIIELIKWYANLDTETQQLVGSVLGWGKVLNEVAGFIAPFAVSVAGLAVTFSTASTAAIAAGTSLGGLLIPLAAGLAAVGGITFGVLENIKAWEDYQNQTGLSADASENIAEVSGLVVDALADLNTSLGTSFTSMEEFNEAVNSGALVWDEVTDGWIKAGTASNDLVTATDKATDAAESHGEAIGMTVDEFEAAIKAEEDLNQTLQTSAGETKKVADTKRGYGVVIDEVTGKVIEYTQAGGAFNKKEKEKQEEVKKSVLELASYQTKMEEIASNERIKTIEAKVSLDIATMETDAERVKSAFDSIDTSINSTGDLLGTLFGALIDADSLSDKWAIESQIDKENELRQQSFDLQKQLAEAEIARIEAQVRAMDAGQATIQIDGTGLEPELEAFMWRILEKIRVRANAEFQDYLLGAAAA